jgi:hypothetical protein
MSNYSYALATSVYDTNPYTLPAQAPAAPVPPLMPKDWREIQHLIREHDMPKITSLITKHGGPEACFRQFCEENTILHLAHRYGNMDTLRALLEMKADPNLKPVDDSFESRSVFQCSLWEHGLDSKQDTQIEKIKLLLAHGGDPLDSEPKSVRQIKADADITPRHTFTNIWFAMDNCNETVIMMLLERCVGTWFDPNTKDYAVRNPSDFQVQDALYKAIARNLEAPIKLLVTKLGANPNSKSKCTYCWLFAEAVNVFVGGISPEVCTTLLNVGANPFVEDMGVDTPHMIITRCHKNSPETFTNTFQVMNDHVRYRLTVLFFRKLRALPSRTYDGFFRGASKELIQHILGFCIPDTATFRPNIVFEK